MNNNHELLTVNEVAQLLRVDTSTVRRWIKQGTLEAVLLPSAGTSQSFRIHRDVIKSLTEPRSLLSKETRGDGKET